MSKYCIAMAGDSNGWLSYSHFYQALGVAASDVYDEIGSNVRKAMVMYPAADVMARNYAAAAWTIANLETQAAELDALIPDNYSAVSGRPARYYPLVVAIGTNGAGDANAAAACTRLRTYLLARQARGFLPLVCTLPSNTSAGIGNTTFDTTWGQPINTIIRTWTQSDGVYGVIDHAADANIGGTGAADNIVYFDVNRIHPNTTAVATYTAPRTQAALNTLIDSLGGGTPL